MGVISGVGVREEPRADGYLRGQVWNRPIPEIPRRLSFRVIHQSTLAQEASTNGYLTTVAFYLRGGYTPPAGLSQEAAAANFRRLDEPGYYSDEEATFTPASLILPSWQRPPGQLAAWSPRIKYKDLIPFTDISALYYYDAIRPDIWWQKEASLVRVEGFDSLPNILPIGGEGVDLSAQTTTVFFDDNKRAVDLSLNLDNLTFRYYAISFSAETEYYDQINSRLTLINRIAVISASVVSKRPLLDNFDDYPAEANEELGLTPRPDGQNTVHVHYLGDRTALTRVFVYDTKNGTGEWRLTSSPTIYEGFSP